MNIIQSFHDYLAKNKIVVDILLTIDSFMIDIGLLSIGLYW